MKKTWFSLNVLFTGCLSTACMWCYKVVLPYLCYCHVSVCLGWFDLSRFSAVRSRRSSVCVTSDVLFHTAPETFFLSLLTYIHCLKAVYDDVTFINI